MTGALTAITESATETYSSASVASLAYEGISSGIEEYSRSQDFGKAVGKGSLDMVASVGPLEGATIGAAIGGAPGAVLGAGIGLAIQGVKFIEPKFFDDPVQGTKNIIGKVGKGIEGGCAMISDAFGGIGKALGFG